MRTVFRRQLFLNLVLGPSALQLRTADRRNLRLALAYKHAVPVENGISGCLERDPVTLDPGAWPIEYDHARALGWSKLSSESTQPGYIGRQEYVG